jgi:S-adenosyl-L-methionine hydrolase (adenosine-forming)
MDAIITLTTDFGEDSPYAAAMKGVILGINPQARLVDLTHSIPPQNLLHAAFFLEAAIPLFPKEALHLVVVDPGVGTDRALLYAEIEGHRFVVPDNGCWTWVQSSSASIPRIIRIQESRYWRAPVSKTFHGRDILAPVAAHLSLGLQPELLGPATCEWVKLASPEPDLGQSRAIGSVVFIDHFGNLLTNLRQSDCEKMGEALVFKVGAAVIPGVVATYGQACPGDLIALYSSSGRLEFAVNQGSAAALLHARVGMPVEVIRAAEQQTGAAVTGGALSLGPDVSLEPVQLGSGESSLGDFVPDVSERAAKTHVPKMRGSILAPLVIIPLISYAVLATIAVIVLLMRSQSPDPLERLPDLEGQFKGAKHNKHGGILYERIRPDAPLPARLRARLGERLRVGDVEIHPEKVELRKVYILQPGFEPESGTNASLVLHFAVRNVSEDTLFSPTDPFFDRRSSAQSPGGAPYTCLEIGEHRFYGGALNWTPGRPEGTGEVIDGQHYKILEPGEELATQVCTDPEVPVPQALEGYRGPLLWRIWLRRGLVQIGDREVSATAVVGVEFRDSDIR